MQDKTWVNDKIKRLFSARHSALCRRDRDSVRQLKATIQAEICKAKARYAASVEKLFDCSDCKAWRNLKSLLKLSNVESTCTADPDTLNTFYNRYDKQTNYSLPALPPKLEDVKSVEVSRDLVYVTLNKINTRKSMGPDNIPARLLKTAAWTLADPLCELFNNCIKQGVYPDIWKQAVIRPIPKSAGATAPKDFRPVALTSVVSKTFERVVKPVVCPALTDNTQYAYRPNRSTEDAVASLIDTVSAHLNENAKNFVRCLFVDFSSAFNTISPVTLLNQLTESNKLHPNILHLLLSFLTQRKQTVISNNDISAQLTSSTGCPQGCVLSPVLFSLYIQDTPALDTSFQTIKYADDLAILELVRYNSVSMIHHAADTLLNWCTNLDLVINVTKTKDMIFSNARDSPNPDQLVINTTTVEQVDKFKYLGTVLR